MLTAPEESAACAHLQRLAEASAFSHSKDEAMGDSLSGSARRRLDSASWKWDWRTSPGDPAPIVAATGALWLLASRPSGEPSVYVF